METFRLYQSQGVPCVLELVMGKRAKEVQKEGYFLAVLPCMAAKICSVDIGTRKTRLTDWAAHLCQEAEEVKREGQELVKEVWAVVSDYYLDARGSGFDQNKWAALRDKYLAQPLPTHEAAYRCLFPNTPDMLQRSHMVSVLLPCFYSPGYAHAVHKLRQMQSPANCPDQECMRHSLDNSFMASRLVFSFVVGPFRAIREMLAYGLNDPYTRFITPDEFQAMRKYDVTGVGLNLATAEEFTRKSGLPLPADRADAQVALSFQLLSSRQFNQST